MTGFSFTPMCSPPNKRNSATSLLIYFFFFFFFCVLCGFVAQNPVALSVALPDPVAQQNGQIPVRSESTSTGANSLTSTLPTTDWGIRTPRLITESILQVAGVEDGSRAKIALRFFRA